MNIQRRLLNFIKKANWFIFALAVVVGFLTAPPDFAWGIVAGGLIVTVNFHLLYRTLRKSLAPSSLSNHNVVLAKYYLRFVVSGIIIFVLIANHYVNPIGLFIGLSVVVVSIMLATIIEFRNLLLKEAV